VLVVLLALSGCGSSGQAADPEALKLRREDLLAVARALELAARPVAVEVAAAKRAWPFTARGLPRVIPAEMSPAIAAAATSAAGIAAPAPLQEAQARSLTGPAAEIGGLFRSYLLLSSRGWRLLGAAVAQLEGGSRPGAVFARENAALYIESVYDSHFTLAQIGKRLLTGYRELGGSGAFGSTLTLAHVNALARAYSEASDRLHPHVGVRLGS
jgi:hypothetical protein